ncbi:restriction endonuclease subunit S, partial [Streptococcus sobrinus]
MNLLEEIQNAPVEWKSLGEILEKGKGTKITASQMKSLHQDGAPIRIFAGGKTFADVPYGTIPDKDVHNEPSIIVKSRGIVEFEYYTKPFSFKNEFWSYSSSKENINLKYIYYCLNNKQQYFQDIANKMQMPQIASRDTENFKIPIPPLSIQEKIVQTLDKFTDYVTELTLRQKQYSYFRDYLLNFDQDSSGGANNKVEWKTIEDIGKVSSGGTPKTSVESYYQGEIPWLRTQEVDFKEIWSTTKKISEEGLKNSSAKWIPENCVIIAMYGATVGKVGINKIPLTTNQACANIELNSQQANYKYVYYYLASKYEYIKSLGAGSQTNISAQIVKKLQIPIPSLSIQEKIVHVLDNFDTVCNDLNIGLPKEIELRQKQYEYFRDQLLTYTAEGVYTDSTVQYRQDLIRLLWYVFGPIKVTFGAISDLSRGKRVVKSQLSENKGYPVYQNSLRPLGFYSESNRQAKQS